MPSQLRIGTAHRLSPSTVSSSSTASPSTNTHAGSGSFNFTNALTTTYSRSIARASSVGSSIQINAAPERRLVSGRRIEDLSPTPSPLAFVRTTSKAEPAALGPRVLPRSACRLPSRKQEAPLLSRYSRDLTQLAADGALDPLVGRASELERMTQILARRQKNNPVLIGDPGVGKTAVVEGLAQKIASEDVPDVLLKKRIIQLDLAAILAGASVRGEFEKRFKDVLQEVAAASGNAILFIDELHTLVGLGRAGNKGDSSIDASNIIKPILARGEVQCIGVTSLEEYRVHIEKDKALERRFQPIHISETSVEETIQILKAVAKNYEDHHKVKYTEGAMIICAKASAQYITDRYLPDKAIDIFDESGSRVRLKYLRQEKTFTQTFSLQKELIAVRAGKETAVREEDFIVAAEMKKKELALQEQLKSSEVSSIADNEDISTAEGSSFDDSDGGGRAVVTEDDIAQTISEWTGVPLEKISAAESVQLVGLEATLHKRVIGQDEAVAAIAKALRRSRAGLRNPMRPIASFMFCGPTGVGKTELCKALAAAYFGLEDSMLRLDMSEFMESHSVSKLIGSSPGYVGYGDENQFTDRIRRKPYSLVLLDEVEKAHPDVLNIALQLLEDGRLTDAKGRVVSFRNALIIMTSNIGSAAIEQELSQGGDVNYAELKAVTFSQVSKVFLPEFLNRLDEVIAFKSLTKCEVAQIADLEFQKVISRVKENRIRLSVTEAFKMRVVNEGFNVAYGARPLRRAVVRHLEDKLADFLLRHTPLEDEHVIMDLDDDGLVAIYRADLHETEVAESMWPPCVEVLDGGGEAKSDEVIEFKAIKSSPEVAFAGCDVPINVATSSDASFEAAQQYHVDANHFGSAEADDAFSASRKLSSISAKIDAMLKRAETAQKNHEAASERRMQQLRADLALPES